MVEKKSRRWFLTAATAAATYTVVTYPAEVSAFFNGLSDNLSTGSGESHPHISGTSHDLLAGRSVDEQIDIFMRATSVHESGNNTTITNRDTGAYGLYQILPDNWPEWAAAAGLGSDAPQTEENQHKVARYKFREYYDKFTNGDYPAALVSEGIDEFDAMAISWFAGESRVDRLVFRHDQSVWNFADTTDTTVRSYVDIRRSGIRSIVEAES